MTWWSTIEDWCWTKTSSRKVMEIAKCTLRIFQQPQKIGTFVPTRDKTRPGHPSAVPNHRIIGILFTTQPCASAVWLVGNFTQRLIKAGYHLDLSRTRTHRDTRTPLSSRNVQTCNVCPTPIDTQNHRRTWLQPLLWSFSKRPDSAQCTAAWRSCTWTSRTIISLLASGSWYKHQE
jgi:hypothetical protein